jgi:hypothetical protein
MVFGRTGLAVPHCGEFRSEGGDWFDADSRRGNS